ncbi:MAG: hypothetical protein F4194_01270 [Acidimicrobiia bacterium]|nr:hypothetical protein [Acidimicrobiia bacterium]
METTQRSTLREAGFTGTQTNALAAALEPLATKDGQAVLRGDLTELQGDVTELRSDVTELRSDVTQLQGDVTELRGDVTELRSDLAVLCVDVRWMKWVGGAIGLTVLAEMVSGFFS